jgi:hypothetical protein
MNPRRRTGSRPKIHIAEFFLMFYAIRHVLMVLVVAEDSIETVPIQENAGGGLRS